MGSKDNSVITLQKSHEAENLEFVGMRKLSGACDKMIKDYFFKTLSISVHPIIILRLLFHKMFGKMVKKKTALVTVPSKQRNQGTILEEEGHGGYAKSEEKTAAGKTEEPEKTKNDNDLKG